ncbi:DUF2909 domain-containing protein [Roseateles amylovorans]|jgi:Protein of unknown function (DUF2909)|uniref:DUF2909 domain-containing protein n=1 Tax=Roseateles amylovorans TaxID=2978473 RepID=A0ABY6B110_9BURK|nr:DUF2909 domain-containing protein [Roseateles amylovorans]UXH77674.1 DUF2909 domain-containing protein [Roseateles amylovorans]
MKIIVIVAFIGILGALFSAGVLMLRRQKGKASMARALALRVGLSVALFLIILFSAYMGWIKPTGLPVSH